MPGDADERQRLRDCFFGSRSQRGVRISNCFFSRLHWGSGTCEILKCRIDAVLMSRENRGKRANACGSVFELPHQLLLKPSEMVAKASTQSSGTEGASNVSVIAGV